MMDIQKMKDVFMCGYLDTIQYVLDYLKNEVGISEVDYWNFIGYYVISVPPQEYEKALLYGKKIACQKDFGMYWINHYDVKRGPIAASDVGFGIYPTGLLPGEFEEKCFKRDYWGNSDDKTPKIVLEYFNDMRDYLKVDKVLRYNGYGTIHDGLIISPLNPNYYEVSELFREFVEKYGYGPFKEIHPLTFSGEYVDEPIMVKKI